MVPATFHGARRHTRQRPRLVKTVMSAVRPLVARQPLEVALVPILAPGPIFRRPVPPRTMARARRPDPPPQAARAVSANVPLPVSRQTAAARRRPVEEGRPPLPLDVVAQPPKVRRRTVALRVIVRPVSAPDRVPRPVPGRPAPRMRRTVRVRLGPVPVGLMWVFNAPARPVDGPPDLPLTTISAVPRTVERIPTGVVEEVMGVPLPMDGATVVATPTPRQGPPVVVIPRPNAKVASTPLSPRERVRPARLFAGLTVRATTLRVEHEQGPTMLAPVETANLPLLTRVVAALVVLPRPMPRRPPERVARPPPRDTAAITASLVVPVQGALAVPAAVPTAAHAPRTVVPAVGPPLVVILRRVARFRPVHARRILRGGPHLPLAATQPMAVPVGRVLTRRPAIALVIAVAVDGPTVVP